MKKATAIFMTVLGVGFAFAFLMSLAISWLVGMVMFLVIALLDYVILALMVPRLAKESWTAEENNGVLVLLHTNDNKILPIAGKYTSKKDFIEPIDASYKGKLAFLPDREGTIPLHGQKSKIAHVHIDFPFTISPEYFAVVYDLKYKYGLENLAQALDFNEYVPKKIDELKETLAKHVAILSSINNWFKTRQIDEELKGFIEALGGDPNNIEVTDMERLRYLIMERIKNLENVLKVAEKYSKPIVMVGGRFYTLDTLMGYFGAKIKFSNIRALMEFARLETIEKFKKRSDEIIRWSVLIVSMAIATVLILAVLGHINIPTQLPNVQVIPQLTNITNMTGG